MSWWKITLIVFSALALVVIAIGWYVFDYAELDIYVPLYVDNCAQCHGAQLEGTERGLALVGAELPSGESVGALQASIKNAHIAQHQLAITTDLTDVEIKGLAIFIGERRLGQRFTQFQFDRDIHIPGETLTTQEHSFVIETVIEGLDPLVFSIEPLPDGSILLTEKERGLSIISPEGTQSELIVGTPETGSSLDIMGIQYGSGWLLDVAIHPDYENNGWIYLHYTHLCGELCDNIIMSASMNRLDRGHIVDGKWADVETIWQAPLKFYAETPDTGAGGRVAFDDSGHVYLSVGLKSADGFSDTSAQDLSSPYGKIHRLRDDGTIPADNPYVAGNNIIGGDNALESIWTYGHRSPQGLEWHPVRKRVWNSEMGPRGGDELNELLAAHNYGWPYHSLGLEYAGEEVERHKPKAIEFDERQVEQTLVNITPSPAISSFVVYSGDRFPGWQDNVLIGSLKGSSLFRMAFDGNALVHRETLIKDLARIRDVEVGFDGLVYLLLENEAGSSIVKLSPRDKPTSL
jgi:glucose/arabinose dehydrogenase